MNTCIFAKPDVNFSYFEIGPIAIFLEADYSLVTTQEQLIEFMNKWIGCMENSTRENIKSNIGKVIIPLYSMITGKSYESKITML